MKAKSFILTKYFVEGENEMRFTSNHLYSQNTLLRGKMRCGLHPIVSALALALAQSYVQVGLQPLLSSMLDNNT